MKGRDTQLVKFMLCETEKEAIEIINDSNSKDLFTALIDVNGDFLDISTNASNLLGFDKAVLRNESMFRMTHRSDKAELFKAFSVTMTKGATFRFQHRIKCYNGQYLPIISHMKRVESDKNYAVVFCLMVRA